MSIHEQKLRSMAKQMPIFATELVAAADEMAKLSSGKVLETLSFNIGVQFLEGELPELVNKIKANAVREALKECSYEHPYGSGTDEVNVDDLYEYAKKTGARQMKDNIERLQARIKLHELEREKARELGDYLRFEREEAEIKNVTAMIEMWSK